MTATTTSGVIANSTVYPVNLNIKNIKDNSTTVVGMTMYLQIVRKSNITKSRPFIMFNKQTNYSTTSYKTATIQKYVSKAASAILTNLTVPARWGIGDSKYTIMFRSLIFKVTLPVRMVPSLYMILIVLIASTVLLPPLGTLDRHTRMLG